jgi:Restriction endonuclease XhoI
MDLAKRFQTAIEEFWNTRNQQQHQQRQRGKADTGSRGAVTGGAQLRAVEAVLTDLVRQTGLTQLEICSGRSLELPGYYRPEKQWDIILLSQKKLVAALELKSQVGPSFGNHINNRTEEAIGSAQDLWTAFREGLFGSGLRPFLGYFFLLEDCLPVHKSVKATDPVFRGASYRKRYEILCQRLARERLYDAACLTLSPNTTPTTYPHPSQE